MTSSDLLSIYLDSCRANGGRPNAGVCAVLSALPAAMSASRATAAPLASLDLDFSSAYLGNPGLLALIPVLRAARNRIRSINLSRCGLRMTGSTAQTGHPFVLFITELYAHGGLISLDLSRNELGNEAGELLLGLLHRRPLLYTVAMEGTAPMAPAMLGKIQSQCARNKDPNNGHTNDRCGDGSCSTTGPTVTKNGFEATTTEPNATHDSKASAADTKSRSPFGCAGQIESIAVNEGVVNLQEDAGSLSVSLPKKLTDASSMMFIPLWVHVVLFHIQQRLFRFRHQMHLVWSVFARAFSAIDTTLADGGEGDVTRAILHGFEVLGIQWDVLAACETPELLESSVPPALVIAVKESGRLQSMTGESPTSSNPDRSSSVLLPRVSSIDEWISAEKRMLPYSLWSVREAYGGVRPVDKARLKFERCSYLISRLIALGSTFSSSLLSNWAPFQLLAFLRVPVYALLTSPAAIPINDKLLGGTNVADTSTPQPAVTEARESVDLMPRLLLDPFEQSVANGLFDHRLRILEALHHSGHDADQTSGLVRFSDFSAIILYGGGSGGDAIPFATRDGLLSTDVAIKGLTQLLTKMNVLVPAMATANLSGDSGADASRSGGVATKATTSTIATEEMFVDYVGLFVRLVITDDPSRGGLAWSSKKNAKIGMNSKSSAVAAVHGH